MKPRQLLTHVDVQVDEAVDRVRLTVSRLDSSEVLSLLMSGAEARSIAQQLIRCGAKVQP